jgi:transcriptional antiterminator NusG
MDTKDEPKKEEIIEKLDDSEVGEVSLDDMMAESVEPEAEVIKPVVAVIEPEEIIEIANEQTETPVIANDAPTGASEAISDESETTTDMIEETVNEATEEAKDEAETAKSAVVAPTPKKVSYLGKWYIVHTYSGHENKVAKTLMQRVQAMGFESRIFDALVPTRDTIRVRGGKKETIKEKIFPGYILVNMDLSDEAWVLVRTTPGVTSFVGAQNKPTAIRDDEVQAIVAFVEQKDPIYRAQFSVGEAVKITDGPFSDFLGTVESIDDAKGKVKVLVSIFGRETPVELDFLQVAKI